MVTCSFCIYWVEEKAVEARGWEEADFNFNFSHFGVIETLLVCCKKKKENLKIFLKY